MHKVEELMKKLRESRTFAERAVVEAEIAEFMDDDEEDPAVASDVSVYGAGCV